MVAFDDDLAARLAAREEAAMGDWKRIAGLLAYFEQHPEWRAMREDGQLAVVQDPAKGGLLSGGILDMIAVKHTPVRPVPRQQLSAEALAGATMAVNVDAAALTPEQKEILRSSRAAAARCSPDRPAGKTPPRQPADHAGEGRTGTAQRYLARRQFHDRPAQHGRAAVQRLVDAVQLPGRARTARRPSCTW